MKFPRSTQPEGTRGLGFFLATIDQNVSDRQLHEMLRHRINLVVPAHILTGNTVYSAAENVIDFESFFLDHLDPAMVRWQRRSQSEEQNV